MHTQTLLINANTGWKVIPILKKNKKKHNMRNGKGIVKFTRYKKQIVENLKYPE